MPVLAVVACSLPDLVFLVHFCFAGEDEHSDFELAVCLATAAAEVVLLDSGLVLGFEELLAFVAGSYSLESKVVGNP